MAVTSVIQDGARKNISASYSNRPSLFPDNASLTKDYVVDRYFMKGFAPKDPFIKIGTPIVAFGSCFAANISKYLHNRGYNVLTRQKNQAYVTQMGDGMVHTFAIRQQFEWAWENKFPSVALWEGYDHEEFGYTDEARLATKKLFDEAEVFIITLGLSEIWYDEPTGEVFWRAPPKGRMDPSRHKFRVATFAESKANIQAIRKLIAEYRPDARVVFTVSPIPLAASFRPVAALSANAASKAILRAAVDEFYRDTKDGDDNLYYFPSYDVVQHGFDNQFGMDRRHVSVTVLDFNMKMFERYFCTPGLDDATLLESYRRAQKRDKRLGKYGLQTPEEAQALARIMANGGKVAAGHEPAVRSSEQQAKIDAKKAKKRAARILKRRATSTEAAL